MYTTSLTFLQKLSAQVIAPVTPASRTLVEGNGVNSATNAISGLFTSAFSWISLVAGAVALSYLILGGIRYIQAAADPKKIESARKTIYSAMIGIGISTAAFLIIRIAIALGGVASGLPAGNSLF